MSRQCGVISMCKGVVIDANALKYVNVVGVASLRVSFIFNCTSSRIR